MTQLLNWTRKAAAATTFCLGIIAMNAAGAPKTGSLQNAPLQTAALQNPPGDAAPDEAMAAKLIVEARAYAERYVTNLPNFICEQVTEQYEAGRKPTNFKKGDTLTSKLVFSKGREQRTLELVNNNTIRPGMRRWRTPLDTEGEFGNLIDSVFDAVENTGFRWSRWESIGNTRCAVFDYAVDVEHSTLRLRLSDLAQATVPYRGTVSVDPSTGSILRITDTATEIPKEVRTRNISTAIDYESIDISGTKYLLPVHATVLVDTGSNNIRNELSFRNYRKFEVESNITFGSSTEPASEQAPKNNPPPPRN